MGIKLRRKTAQPVSEIVTDVFKSMGLSYGMNNHLIFEAWERISGAGPYTVKRFFRDGKLYITLNSSVVRSQLQIQESILLEKIKGDLASVSGFSTQSAKCPDPLFSTEASKRTDGQMDPKIFVKQLILK